jgi:hypothetical protein
VSPGGCRCLAGSPATFHHPEEARLAQAGLLPLAGDLLDPRNRLAIDLPGNHFPLLSACRAVNLADHPPHHHFGDADLHRYFRYGQSLVSQLLYLLFRNTVAEGDRRAEQGADEMEDGSSRGIMRTFIGTNETRTRQCARTAHVRLICSLSSSALPQDARPCRSTIRFIAARTLRLEGASVGQA